MASAGNVSTILRKTFCVQIDVVRRRIPLLPYAAGQQARLVKALMFVGRESDIVVNVASRKTRPLFRGAASMQGRNKRLLLALSDLPTVPLSTTLDQVTSVFPHAYRILLLSYYY